MHNNATASNNIVLKLNLSLAIFCYLFLCAFISCQNIQELVFPESRLLSLASLIYFLILLAISQVNEKTYCFILPLVAITVPNAINHLFPSVLLGYTTTGNYEVPAFSLFTHIDVFLYLGIIRYCDFCISWKQFKMIMLLSTATLCLYLFWLQNEQYYIIFMGSFQFRYIVLLFILIEYSTISNNINYFYKGVMLSGLYLILESTLFSITRDTGGRLTSGNFGVNSLSHLFTAIVAMSFWNNSVNKISRYIMSCAYLLASFATGTRFSIVALLLSLIIIYIIKTRKLTYCIVGVLLVVSMGLVLVKFSSSFSSLFNGLISVSSNISDPADIDRTEDTSSMITRLIVWNGTINMILARPISGVGPAVWSFNKQDFLIPYEQIYDPHNDILNYLVSYGLILGILIYFIIFIRPVIIFNQKPHASLIPLTSFILCLFIAGLTNAVTWKPGISLLVYMSSLLQNKLQMNLDT